MIRETILHTVADVSRNLHPGDDEDSVFQRDSAEAFIKEIVARPDSGCICEGNWRSIINKTEHLFGKFFDDSNGEACEFLGVLHADDDYYYTMLHVLSRTPRLLSCAGSIEGHGYKPTKKESQE